MLKNIQTEIKLVRLSLASYSRLPVGGNLVFESDLLAKSIKYFPLVGFLLGGILAISYWLLSFILPLNIAIILVMAFELILTGAMHHDGLADVCDAFGASRDKTRILAIMKDSHIGVYGVLGIAVMLLLHYVTLSNFNCAQIPFIILTGNTFSRIAAPIFVGTHCYVTPNETSKSKAMLSKLNWKEISVSVIIGLLPVFLLLNWQFWFAIIIPMLVFLLFMHYCTKRIGGYTGDCLGATQKFTEVLFYLSIVIIANHYCNI